MLPAVALLLLLLAYGLLPWLALRWQRADLRRRCRRQRVIALTFDDGPGAVLTPQVLARLAGAGARATFFVLGRNAAAHAGLLAAIRRGGHDLGSHGHAHLHHLRSLPWRSVADTRLGVAQLLAWAPDLPRPLLFRPPFGKLNLVSLGYALLRGLRLANWTHDGLDAVDGARPPVESAAQALRRDGGGVLLLHDFDRHDPAAGADVLARLDAVLALRNEGFRFVRLRDLLSPAR